MNRSVKIHTQEQIELARAAGHAAAQVLAMIAPHVQPGVTTEELDDICHDFIVNELKVIPRQYRLSGLHAHHLHLGESCGVSRHSLSQKAEKRGYRQY